MLTVLMHKNQITLLSLTVLLVTSMVTTTSISGSRGHLELIMGFVMGLWMMWTVTAEVAWTSNDVAPLGVDLKQREQCWVIDQVVPPVLLCGAKYLNLELKSSLNWVERTQKPSSGDEMRCLNFICIISVALLSKQSSHWRFSTSVRG